MTTVRTDHYVHAEGLERMVLTDGKTPTPIVTATLTGEVGEPGVWILEADGVPSATAEDRTKAIEAMGNLSLAALGISGASLYVPPEVVALP